MAAVLTDAMKNDLATGNAKVKLVLWTDTALSATTFADAESLFTTAGSLAINQGAPTMTPIKLDQKLEVVASPVTDVADSTVAATIPFLAMPILEYFYEEATTQPSASEATPLVIDGDSYTEAKAFRFNGNVVKARVYLKSQSGNTAIVLMKTDLALSLSYSDVNATPAGFALAGNILEDGARGSIVVLKG